MGTDSAAPPVYAGCAGYQAKTGSAALLEYSGVSAAVLVSSTKSDARYLNHRGHRKHREIATIMIRHALSTRIILLTLCLIVIAIHTTGQEGEGEGDGIGIYVAD